MKTFHTGREGCGEGRPITADPSASIGPSAETETLSAENEHSIHDREDPQRDLHEIPRRPTGIWSATDASNLCPIGLSVPVGSQPNFDEPLHAVWPWMNPAGQRSGNTVPRRLALDNWVYTTMRETAQRDGSDGTEIVRMAIAEMACTELPEIPQVGLWPEGDRVAARDFVVAWWRYLSLRWEAFGEWPDPVTQIETLRLLATWRDPIACVRQSLAGSFKGVYPLRSDIDGDLYEPHAPIVVAATRRYRVPHTDGATVRDTFRAYTLRPDWSARLQSLKHALSKPAA